MENPPSDSVKVTLYQWDADDRQSVYAGGTEGRKWVVLYLENLPRAMTMEGIPLHGGGEPVAWALTPPIQRIMLTAYRPA